MSSSRTSSTPAFARLVLRTRDPACAERAAATAFEAGASGLEEREEGGAIELWAYAPLAGAPALAEALLALSEPGLEVGAPAPVPETDWSERWKQGLEAVEVSPRLRVRPPFRPVREGPAEVVIEPGQAFGTGGHASTRLALEWVDLLAGRGPAPACVLDAGTGSGVLALAALRLGAERAVGFDLDPLAAPAARANARTNALEARLALFTGPVEALAPRPFDWVVANLLRSELLPLLPELARRTAPGGALVLSGLLAAEVPVVAAACAEHGLAPGGERRAADPSGDLWAALLMRR